MLGVSADTVFDVSNCALLASLIVGLIATFGIVRSGKIKEDALNVKLSEANAAAEKAKNDAAIADHKAAVLNERAAALEKEAAQACLETERIKLLISWRMILPAQRDKITLALRNHSFSIDIVCATSDAEACEYASQLVSVLKESGLKVGFDKLMATSRNPDGLLLSGPQGPEIELLASALKSASVPFSFWKESQNLQLRVGHKPR